LNFGPFFMAALLAAATSHPAATALRTHATAANNAVSVTTTVPAPAGTPAGPVAGDPAPDFSYQSHDFLWQNLHNMLEQGSVLLVFGAGEADLRAIERERESLVRQGVLPVAVIERREGDVWKLLHRTEVTYSLLADPHGAIAEQYGVYEPGTSGARTTWFVIDQSGRVRQAGAGSLGHSWSQVAADALGQGGVHTASAN